MTRLKVNIRDKVGKDFRTQEIRRLKAMSKKDTKNLALACEKTIQETIMRKTEMPTGKLASFMKAEPIVNGWGVGDIATLDKQVPYWNHIDKGSQGIGANWQHFLPKGYWDGNFRWVEDDSGYSGIMPQRPILAINYIAETLQLMQIQEKQILNRT